MACLSRPLLMICQILLWRLPLAPLTASDVSGHLDRSVTLRCQLLTGKHNRGWYMIKWHRLEPDGAVTPLISLPARYKVPEWSDKIPPTLQSRVQPIITVQPGHVEFNLVINNLTCSDEGDYRCSAITPGGVIMSAAELGIYAGPQTPKILYELLPGSQPTKIEAACKADVGFPPKMLVWYSRRPDATYFTIVDKQPDVVQQSDGCHTVSTRTFEVIMSPDIKGTHFRCGYPGFIEKEGMYDDLVLDLQTQGQEEVSADRKMAARCDVERCDVLEANKDLSTEHNHHHNKNKNKNNRADSTVPRAYLIIGSSLAFILHRSLLYLSSS